MPAKVESFDQSTQTSPRQIQQEIPSNARTGKTGISGSPNKSTTNKNSPRPHSKVGVAGKNGSLIMSSKQHSQSSRKNRESSGNRIVAGKIVSGSDEIVANLTDIQVIPELQQTRGEAFTKGINEIENLMSTNLSIVSATKLSMFDGRPSMFENTSETDLKEQHDLSK